MRPARACSRVQRRGAPCTGAGHLGIYNLSVAVSQLTPELSRGLQQVARALLVAARNWMLYPPEHPTVESTVNRLCDAIRQSSLGTAFGIGVTPDNLLIDGVAPFAAGVDTAITEAAALLHDRDIVHLTFLGDISYDGIARLLRVLALEMSERRQRGGPARIWAAEGHPTILVEQVDYAKLFAREAGDVTEAANRDELWRAIVMSIAGGQKGSFDERAQQRLLQIAGSAGDITDLAAATMAPMCTTDGSPMITSQAATVLAAFRHLTNIVSVMAPERLPQVMSNLAAASTRLDSHVVMQMMQTPDQPAAGGVEVVGALAAAFDDMQVAQLLATALALEGRASERLATIFNTIAPDEERKRRVLTMARTLLSETDFGKSSHFEALWASTEELLVSYNDAPFVSESYRAALDGAGGRADRMATLGDLPPDLPVWMDSIGQENVRALSVQLLVDLLRMEQTPARAAEIALDMAALAEDLLMAGAYEDVRSVVRALADHAAAKRIGAEACHDALDRLAHSGALRETAQLIGDLDDETFAVVRDVLHTIGPPSVESLKAVLGAEEQGVAYERAAALTVGFGRASVARLASLVHDDRWHAQRSGARLLGEIASPEAVPLLQPLLRKRDPRVVRETVSALCGIDDPSAARAVHTILRSATGDVRSAVIGALVADRDARVVPILARIVNESQALGTDHQVVLETVTALGIVGTDDAVPPLAEAMRVRSFWRRKKARAVKQRCVSALTRVGTPAAEAALADAARAGDRLLRQAIRDRGKA